MLMKRDSPLPMPGHRHLRNPSNNGPSALTPTRPTMRKQNVTQRSMARSDRPGTLKGGKLPEAMFKSEMAGGVKNEEGTRRKGGGKTEIPKTVTTPQTAARHTHHQANEHHLITLIHLHSHHHNALHRHRHQQTTLRHQNTQPSPLPSVALSA